MTATGWPPPDRWDGCMPDECRSFDGGHVVYQVVCVNSGHYHHACPCDHEMFRVQR